MELSRLHLDCTFINSVDTIRCGICGKIITKCIIDSKEIVKLPHESLDAKVKMEGGQLEEWACPACTFINGSDAHKCEVCGN